MSDDAKVVIGGDVTGADAALQQLSKAAADSVNSVLEKFEALNKAAEVLKQAFVDITVAIGGGKMFQEAIHGATELADELRSLRVVLGISADGAAGLKEALAEIGVSSDAYIGIVQRMAIKLRDGEERFNAMGIKTRDSKGHLLDAQQVMENSLTTLQDFKEGTDRDLASTEIFGRSWAEASKLLRLSRDEMEVATQSAAELGLAIGPKQEEQFFRFKKVQAEEKAVMEGLARGVSDILLPRLIELGEWFRSIGPEAIAATKAAIATMTIVIDATISGVQQLWLAFKLLVTQLTILGATLADVVPKLIRWDWTGAKAAAQEGLRQIKESWNTYLADIAKNVEDFKLKVSRALDPEGHLPDAPKEKPGKRRYGGKNTGAIADLDAKAKDAQHGLEIEKQFLELEVAQHRITEEQKFQLEREIEDRTYAYVREIYVRRAALTQAGSAEHRKALQEIADLDAKHATDSLRYQTDEQKAIEKTNTERAAMAAADLDNKIKLADEGLKVEKEYLQQEVEEGALTAKERLSIERDLENSIYAYKQQMLAAKRNLYRTDQKEYQKVLQELEQLDSKHSLELQKNAKETSTEVQKDWKKMGDAITQAFSTSIKGIIQGTTTLQRALSNIWQSIFLEFVDLMVVKPLSQWLETQTKMLAAKITGQQQERAADVADQAAKTVTASADITRDAGETFAGVYAFLAPVMGPAAAGPAAASMAEVMAMLPTAAASGGYDIPAGINPIVQAHAEEMMLPADLSRGIRSMVAGGGGGRDMPDIHIHAVDAKGVERALATGGALDKAIRRLRRNYAPSMR